MKRNELFVKNMDGKIIENMKIVCENDKVESQ